MRCIGFSAIAYIVAPGSRPTCCFLGISTECPEGTPTVVRATKGVVRFTGVSVSLKAVSGSSAGGMIDPRETHNNPRITIVQRTRFTETPQLASQVTRPAVICQRETSHLATSRVCQTKGICGCGPCPKAIGLMMQNSGMP